MATLLYRLGLIAYTRRLYVVAAWLVLLVTFISLAVTFGKSTTTDISIPGVEAAEGGKLLQEQFPDSGAGGAEARMVFAAPQGRQVTDPALRAGIEQSLTDAASANDVLTVTDPFETMSISPDGGIAYATIAYGVAAGDLSDIDRDALFSAGDAAEAAGVQVEVGGEAAESRPGQSATEAVGVLIALIVLVITFGYLLAAGLPLLTALFGVGAGMAGIFALTAIVELTSVVPTLALMIGLAVGIDYALFITTRHRENLSLGMGPRESAARAVATAGSAVIFAGATVIVALAALSVVGIPFMTRMGLVSAAMVALAVAVALTLVPAFLGIAGARFLRWPIPGLQERQERRQTRQSFGARWAALITRRPVAFLVAGVISTGVMAIPAFALELGLPDDSYKAEGTTQREAYDLLAEGFGPGFNGPLTVVIDGQTTNETSQSEVKANVTRAATDLSTRASDLDDVATTTPPVSNSSGDTAIVNVIPKSSPASTETKGLVTDLRELRGVIEAETGTQILVTGNTAVGIDVSQKLTNALPVFLVVVVGLSIILLTIAFRSVIVPIKATLGFLLSLAAAFGALVAVFQWGWLSGLLGIDQTGPVISYLPVLLVGLIFGLAMDYEVFLVSRMREDHIHGASSRESVIGGFRHGARVVTAAALIMASVFGGFIFANEATVKSIGFALAFGVLVDAFVVRMTIVPAVMTLLGERAWRLPRWLDRLLPNVDIEGAGLAPYTVADHSGASGYGAYPTATLPNGAAPDGIRPGLQGVQLAPEKHD